MNSFSKRSKEQLDTCDIRLHDIFHEVLQHCDCTVLEGYRNEEKQNALYETRKSQLRFPDGKHNQSPSRGVDVTPYPIDWHDRERITLFAGFVLGIATGMGHELRWGGDWDRDWEVFDNNFDDLVHFEIV